MAESKDAGTGGAGRPVLSPLIHGRVRLLVLSFLLRCKKPAPFTLLRDELMLTDGTLSVNLGKLEEGGLVKVTKHFVGKRPQSRVKITAQGRRQFRQYVRELRTLIPELDNG